MLRQAAYGHVNARMGKILFTLNYVSMEFNNKHEYHKVKYKYILVNSEYSSMHGNRIQFVLVVYGCKERNAMLQRGESVLEINF